MILRSVLCLLYSQSSRETRSAYLSRVQLGGGGGVCSLDGTLRVCALSSQYKGFDFTLRSGAIVIA